MRRQHTGVTAKLNFWTSVPPFLGKFVPDQLESDTQIPGTESRPIFKPGEQGMYEWFPLPAWPPLRALP